MSSSDDEDFGGLDDEDLVLAAAEVDQTDLVARAAKRRRLSSHGQAQLDHVSDGSDGFEAPPRQARTELARPRPALTPKIQTRRNASHFVNSAKLPRSRQLSPHKLPASCPPRPAASSRRHAVGNGKKSAGNRQKTGAWSPDDEEFSVQTPSINTRCHSGLVELDGLPSDAFVLSSSPGKAQEEQARGSSHTAASISRHGAASTQGVLRQTTLFGGTAQGQNFRRSDTDRDDHIEADTTPTHHKLNQPALTTWVYPTNLGGVRDYQFNIVKRGLFHNLLVALPTGLGKTFIAATIMLNWFRWTVDAQIIFVAPTKPLVAQQVEACFGIVGIPRSQTTLLTGEVPRAVREEEWASKRVFFLTPQTLINDLRTGICDPKRVVCLVVDEAHRATGNYAYVEVVKFLRTYNTSFRVLALTATPGSSVEAVQEVIDGLDIARVEIRTEESLDIRQYVHKRNIDTVLFDPAEEMTIMKDLFSKTLQPILDQLNQANAYWVRDPMSLTPFGLCQARGQWMNSEAGRRASQGMKGKMHAIFSLLAGLAHSINLLNYHGIAPFYNYLADFRKGVEGGEGKSKYRKQVIDCPHFHTLMTQARQWVNDPEFMGHPKLEYLTQVVLNHFLDAGEGTASSNASRVSRTRIMIFVEFRDSADEIVRLLKRNEPLIRPRAFIGQSSSKGTAGMNQKTQSEVVKQFQDGTYNTLVATCVGEEGLDIGEVDLIICYDSSNSPIRMLQRMGRTGRKRAGNIVLLLMRGKEGDSFMKAKDGYEKMQQLISEGSRFQFHADLSPRILPKEAQPQVEKKVIEIPLENSQPDLPEPRRRPKGKAKKRAPKKFHMPEGVETGFVKASRLREGGLQGESDDETAPRQPSPEPEEQPIPIPALEDVLLTVSEDGELSQRYQYVYGDHDEDQVISMPRLDAFPGCQRVARRTKYLAHGHATQRVVRMLETIHNMDNDKLSNYERNLHKEDRDAILFKSGSVAGTLKNSSGRVWSSRARSMPAQTPSDNEETLADITVEDDGENEVTSAPSTAPSSVDAGPAPFYTSPKKIATQDSDIEDELPDVTMLVEKRTSPAGPRQISDEDYRRELSSASRRRRSKRVIMSDSDD